MNRRDDDRGVEGERRRPLDGPANSNSMRGPYRSVPARAAAGGR
jgi:hypothetical protein